LKAFGCLEKAFTVFKENPSVLLKGLLVLVLAYFFLFLFLPVPLFTVFLVSGFAMPSQDLLLTGLAVNLLLFLVEVMVFGVLMGGWIEYCVQVIDGKKPVLSLLFSPKNRLSLAALSLVLFVLNLMVFLVLGVIGFLVYSFFGMLTVLLAFFLLLLLAWFCFLALNFFLMFSFYAVILDGTGVLEGVSKSTFLVKKYAWEALFFYLMVVAVSYLAQVIPLVGVFLVFLTIPLISVTTILFYRLMSVGFRRAARKGFRG
jgi:hypothetical protein